jgi:hypothetical protein
MAAAILDRVLERGRFIHLDGPSGRTRHLNLEETLPDTGKRLRISGIGGSEFPEPTRIPGDGDQRFPNDRIVARIKMYNHFFGHCVLQPSEWH